MKYCSFSNGTSDKITTPFLELPTFNHGIERDMLPLGTSETVSCSSIDNTAHLIGNSENSNTPWYGIPILTFTRDVREGVFDFYVKLSFKK